MKLYDQHLHTFISSDSQERFENYIKVAESLGHTHFVTTEHLDLSCHSFGGDDMPDLVAFQNCLDNLQEKTSLQILKGIEIGYKHSRIHDIEAILQKENFDVIIMSVHESETASCLDPVFLGEFTPAQAYDAYLDIYLHMLENIHNYDIVGHVDFLLRYMDKTPIENHEEKLTALCQKIIAQDKCLEFNTRFLYRHDDSSALRYIFALYYACGGRKISLGSDAHMVRDYLGAFDDALTIVKDLGFTHVSTFQKRQENRIKI